MALRSAKLGFSLELKEFCRELCVMYLYTMPPVYLAHLVAAKLR